MSWQCLFSGSEVKKSAKQFASFLHITIPGHTGIIGEVETIICINV